MCVVYGLFGKVVVTAFFQVWVGDLINSGLTADAAGTFLNKAVEGVF